MKTVSALSFWQPYAWLIVEGHADVDSRMWAPVQSRIGTRIAVHSSKRKLTRAEYADFVRMMKELKIAKYPQSVDDFEYGAIVGSVVIAEVVKNSKSYWAAKGYFHWVLKAARPHPPVPMKGQRGWFSVDLALLRGLRLKEVDDDL